MLDQQASQPSLAQRLDNDRLRQALRQRLMSASNQQAVRRAPMSFGQRAIWLHAQLHADAHAYNEVHVLSVKGRLNVAALQTALERVQARHDILRTTFDLHEGEPQQFIHPALPCRLRQQEVDIHGETAAVDAHIQAEASLPFALAIGPLMRVLVLSHGEAEHIVVLTMHHLICDGWSAGLLMHEIHLCYEAVTHHCCDSLPSLPCQYADFATRQRQKLDDTTRANLQAYWRDALNPLPSPLTWPHPRSTQASRSAVLRFDIPATHTHALANLCRTQACTLHAGLLATYAVLLQRYTTQDEFCIGIPSTNRDHPDYESLIGYFVDALPVRCQVDGAMSFKALLANCRHQLLQARKHQQLPTEQIAALAQAAGQAAGRLRTDALFQTLFVLQNTPPTPAQLGPHDVRVLEVDGVLNPKYDIVLEVQQDQATRQWKAAFIYDASLFPDAHITRMAAHWLNLMAEGTRTPDASICSLNMLSPAEVQLVQEAWSSHTAPAATPQHVSNVLTLFYEQCQLRPSAIAVRDATGRAISYQALDDTSTQVAHALKESGVAAGNLIGISLPRGHHQIVSILAIWKAGCAYVPLDPTYPTERLKFMCEDAQLSLVIHDSAETPLASSHIRWLPMDALWRLTPATDKDCDPLPEIAAQDAAYLIYTSGSTGQPKGVLIEHGGLPLLAQAQASRLGITHEDSVLQLASMNFDASVWELVMALAHGATLQLINQELLMSPPRLSRFLLEHGVTTMTISPSMLSAMDEAGLQSINKLIVAGEACPPSLALRFAPGRRFYNAYGPTESTVCASIFEVGPGNTGRADSTTPIGRALPHTRLYVLDSTGALVPPGVPGELFIGGQSLARCYLNQADLTQARFAPSPLGTGERLYRTGDRVMWRDDGELIYLGRNDRQLKVRGQRLELGEIEWALRRCDGVRDAVAYLREDAHGQPVLLACVVPHQSDPPLIARHLDAMLKQWLPRFMQPSRIHVLDTWPLTPNGKLDWPALPGPTSLPTEGPTSHLAPRDALELAVLQLWEEVLGTQGFGVTDNFFDLGGQSLSAVRLIGLLKQQLDIELPVSALSANATVEGVVAHIRANTVIPSTPLVPIQPKGSRPPVYFVHAAGGTVMCYYELARHMTKDQPVYGLQAMGIDAGSMPTDNLTHMATNYVHAIKAHQPHGPYYLGGWSMGGNIAFEMARLLLNQGDEVAFLGLLDASTSAFNNETPPKDDAAILVEMFRSEVQLDEAMLRAMPSSQLLEQAIVVAEQRQWLPPGFTTDHARRLLKVYRMAEQAVKCHRPRTIACEATLFRSTERLPDDPHESPDRGWSMLCPRVHIIDVPGHHLNMVMPPHSSALARQIEQALKLRQAAWSS